MLDIVEVGVEKAGYNYLRLDGSLTMTQRGVVLKDFTQDPG